MKRQAELKRQRCDMYSEDECLGRDQPKEPQDASSLQRQLHHQGWVEFVSGFPNGWDWELFDFVESHHRCYNDLVIKELVSLRAVWTPCRGSTERYGAFAASKVTQRLQDLGLAVFSPLPNESPAWPYRRTGPRWYVSVTQAAIKHFGRAPAPPQAIWEVLMSHPADHKGDLRARGLGWTLAPPGSDPQALHSDLWGGRRHPRTDRVRFPHILWKHGRKDWCTTQIVPSTFPAGVVHPQYYSRLRQVSAAALLVDGEVLHRGAATQPVADLDGPLSGWVSTMSIELCTPSGWWAWLDGTGGTPTQVQDLPEWEMLSIHHLDHGPRLHIFQEELNAMPPCGPRPLPPLRLAFPAQLPEPRAGTEGTRGLLKEQAQWEAAFKRPVPRRRRVA